LELISAILVETFIAAAQAPDEKSGRTRCLVQNYFNVSAKLSTGYPLSVPMPSSKAQIRGITSFLLDPFSSGEGAGRRMRHSAKLSYFQPREQVTDSQFLHLDKLSGKKPLLFKNQKPY